MTWRNCEASIALDAEINARFPGRDKSSDGTIGDAAHASRTSDHNPWVKDPDGTGIVRARDVDEDLGADKAGAGWTMPKVAEHLRSLAIAGDPRLRNGGYLIYEGRIASDRQNFAWRPYTGPNAHTHHLHVSFSLNREGYDSPAAWGIWPATNPTPPKDDDMTPAQEAKIDALAKAVANLAADVAEVKRQVARSEDAKAKGGRTLRHICAADLAKD